MTEMTDRQPITEDDGKILLKKAREYLESILENKPFQNLELPSSSDKTALFVTLHTWPDHELRGCIGFTEPVYKLKDAIVHAAHAAAFEDPRFLPLDRSELKSIIIEISILTKPEPIPHKTPEELLAKITPNKDGLILKKGYNQGLFLPQVWDEISEKTDFLEHLCYKSGLRDRNAWKEKDTTIEKFHVRIFRESKSKRTDK